MDNDIALPESPDAAGIAAAPAPAAAESRPKAIRLPIEFTASGSEYFRIWFVNLLLILVTLGIYYPWARVRKLRYFYSNTRIAGHALDFHGKPSRMLRGYALMGVLFILYSLAQHASPLAALVALLAAAGVWPPLFRAAQQFRLANTSWRGLRFRFTGTTAGAYQAMSVLYLPALAFFALGVRAAMGAPGPGPGVLILILTFASFAAVPLGWWMLKKYQHDNYALGDERTTLRATAGSFYLLALKTLGISLVASAALIGTIILLAIASGVGFSLGGLRGGGGVMVLVFMVFFMVAYVLFIACVGAYAKSRTQNLVWNGTVSRHVRFASQLKLRPLMGLMLKNWLLVVVSLGFYWPFAAVALMRLRLSAMALKTSRPVDMIAGAPRQQGGDATGDAAGELFGFDIGL